MQGVRVRVEGGRGTGRGGSGAGRRGRMPFLWAHAFTEIFAVYLRFCCASGFSSQQQRLEVRRGLDLKGLRSRVVLGFGMEGYCPDPSIQRGCESTDLACLLGTTTLS